MSYLTAVKEALARLETEQYTAVLVRLPAELRVHLGNMNLLLGLTIRYWNEDYVQVETDAKQGRFERVELK